MLKTIKVVYTTRRLSKPEYASLKQYCFVVNEYVSIGDLITSPMYNTPIQVVDIQVGALKELNGIPIKNLLIDSIDRINMTASIENVKESTKYNTKKQTPMKNNMFKTMMEKYKSQFMPTKVEGLRISMDGNLCIPTNDGLVGIDSNNQLISYPEFMTLDVPVFTINKPANQVVEGDIIKHSSYSYSKVLGRTKDGKFRLLSYSGNSTYKADIKDFILGQALVPVVINMFSNMNLGNTNGMNPMMLMMMSEKEESSSMMETMMMMQLMGGQNPMASMFPTKQSE